MAKRPAVVFDVPNGDKQGFYVRPRHLFCTTILPVDEHIPQIKCVTHGRPIGDDVR
jgi:hypothetical protein